MKWFKIFDTIEPIRNPEEVFSFKISQDSEMKIT
jgi:hypothetical protein